VLGGRGLECVIIEDGHLGDTSLGVLMLDLRRQPYMLVIGDEYEGGMD
jgi:hypothetical protein